jgi:hypothetical protein
MKATTSRPNARLLSLRHAEAEYGLPYAQLLDLVKRGELAAVQPPNVRRIFLVRADLERKPRTARDWACADRRCFGRDELEWRACCAVVDCGS